MSTCFLDTSAVVDLMRDRRSVIAATDGYSDLLVSCIAWGELISGVQRSLDPATELRKMAGRFADEQVVGADQETAEVV